LSLLAPPAGDATPRFAGLDPASLEGPMVGILIVDEAEVFLKSKHSFLSNAGLNPLNASTAEGPVGRARNKMRPDPQVHPVRGIRRGLKGVLCAATGFPFNLLGPGERNRRIDVDFNRCGETPE